MLNSISIKPLGSQFETLQSLQPETSPIGNNLQQPLIPQSIEKLEESFSCFLKEKAIPNEKNIEFDIIYQKIIPDIPSLVRLELNLNDNLNPDSNQFSDQTFRECFILFKRVFQIVFNRSKLFSNKPLKTYSDIIFQINAEKNFILDLIKIKKNPKLTLSKKKSLIGKKIQEGLVIDQSKDDQFNCLLSFKAAPILNLFKEFSKAGLLIRQFNFLNFEEASCFPILMDFYLEQINFDVQTFEFENPPKAYTIYFGLGFYSFISQPGILAIYNQFLQDQQTARYKKIKEENEQVLSQKLLQERLDLEKKFSKELSLERKNVFKQAESSLKLDFQSFLFEMLKIFEEGFQERKEISLNNEYLSFLNLQSQALSEMAKERKVLLFNQGLKQGKIVIGAHSQELSFRRDLSQQRLLELIQIKKQEKKEKEVTLKTASIFSRKMMYNLTNDVPATALKWIRLKSLQSDADYLHEKLQQQEASSYNDILLKSKLEMKESDLRKHLEKEAQYTLQLGKLEMEESALRKQLEKEARYTLLAKLEMKESDLRKHLENEAQYTLIKAHNPYGMRPLKCPRLNLT